MNKQNEEAAAPQVVYVNNYNGQLVGEGYPGGVAYIRGDVAREALMRIWRAALEVKEVDLDNNGWIGCTKQMPPETKQTSDTLQGHKEWTESDRVLIWDSMYGCSVDFTKNGKWVSEQRGGYTGQVVHGIIAWRPIPEFSEELLFKAQKGGQKK